MNKTLLSSAMVLAISAPTAHAISYASTGNNFTMLGSSGFHVGGTNDVPMTWDGTLNTSVTDNNINMTLSSSSTFIGHLWTSHHIRVFGPGTYTFNTACTPAEVEAGIAASDCAMVGNNLSMTIGPDQIGAHMLFNWGEGVSTTSCGAATCDIDLVNVWDMDAVFGNGTGIDLVNCDNFPSQCGSTTTDPWSGNINQIWSLASTDDDGDGVPGVPFVDGPFPGFNGNFNLMLVPVPIPAAVWLLGSGLVGLITLARRRNTRRA